MILNGEAWKNRDNTTYTSLLDRYGISDLFSGENMESYQELEEEKSRECSELADYIFSGQLRAVSEEANMVEQVFSQELQFSKLKDYSRKEEDYSVCFVLAELLFVLVFLSALMKLNARRRKRREAYAAEIDLESEGKTGSGPAGL